MPAKSLERIQVVDTHTGGEPTRVVVAGGPDLGSGPLDQRRERLRREFDWFRSATVCEPRGNDMMVGAIVVPPADKTAAAGVIFFNNVGCLGMCGHGTMGVVVALGHLGKLAAGTHRLQTPVGDVRVEYDGENRVSFENVHSWRQAAAVAVEVAGLGRFVGDVAWGGNWFFLVYDHGERIAAANVERLTDVAWRIRAALAEQGVTGAGGEPIDHIELFGPPTAGVADSRSFVLCPGKAYDRSPCGTGTSAKLACLHADGKLQPGQRWRQESIIGSVFEGLVKIDGERVLPRVSGTAYVTAESTLVLDARDPFRAGIPL